MPATARTLHVDRYLTDISVAFVQDDADFVSDKVFPVVPVQKQSDQYVIYDKGSFWRHEVGPRPMGGRADVGDWDYDTGTYLCEEYALAHKIDDRQRANADRPLDLDRQASRYLQTQMAVHNDREWASNYFTTGVWATDLDGSGDTDFTRLDQAGSAPIDLIDEQKEAVKKVTGREPNTLVLGTRVWRALKNHSDIKEVIKYTQTAIVTRDLIARVFDIDDVFIAGAIENTAQEGQTDSLDWIVADDDMLLVYTPENAGLDTPAAGYTFAWTNLLNGAANLMGSAIMRGRDEFAHSDHFEIRSATDMAVVSDELGIFFDTAVSSGF